VNDIKEIIATKSKGGANLLVLLQEAQQRYGHVPAKFMAEVAGTLEVPLSEVYGVATFYSFISARPLGRNIIRVCKSLPCYLRNSEMILEDLTKELDIKPGETTPDGRFSLELTNCIGGCDMAPAMLVNNDLHGDLTPEKISKVLTAYH
jgi:NADH-quinone oxidoreductase E subunit